MTGEARQHPISPLGTKIDIRPICRSELGRVLLRCWPDGGKLETLFKKQETIGFGAWEGDKCIGQLHCYRIEVRQGSDELWPVWSKPPYIQDILNGDVDIPGPLWCFACFHVGRSIESFSQSDEPDERYFHRGIGTALARCSVDWARDHGYAAVVASGTPDALFEFSIWAGGLPWTTYRTLGFKEFARPTSDALPDWIDIAPPQVAKAVERARAAGRPNSDFHSHLMVLQF